MRVSYTNATLGDCLRYGEIITAHCYSCGRFAELDIQALADTLGPAHGAMFNDLAPKLKCSACNGKRLQLLYSNICTRRAGIGGNNWGGT